jgi:hypothetical protein
VDGCFDPAAEPFAVADADALGLGAAMRFRYEQQELSYAATPSLVRHVLDRGHDRVLFFKQESLVTAGFEPVLERLDRAAIVLAPHLLEPVEDSARELAVVLAGTYNLGFLGVADRPPARAFLDWWGERLETLCHHDVAHGFHFEQRWIDFVPGLFDGVEVIREPGAVIGHWSLPERRVAVDGPHVTVDGGPCRLVHFSGHDLDEPAWATRYDRRLRWPSSATPRSSSSASGPRCSPPATRRRAADRTPSRPSTTARRSRAQRASCTPRWATARRPSATRSRPPARSGAAWTSPTTSSPTHAPVGARGPQPPRRARRLLIPGRPPRP